MKEIYMYKSKIYASITTSLVLVSFFFISLGMFTSPAHASTITSINPVADATVKLHNPTSNYGTATTIVCQGDDLEVAYLKFDLTQFAGKSIISAKLRLKTTVDGGSPVAYDLNLISNSSWLENTITYNNSYNGTDATLKPSTPLAFFTAAPSDSWLEIPLTATVSQRKGQMFSIACMPATTSDDAVRFNSKEATADKPALIVEHDIAPTNAPTTAPTTPTPTGGAFGGITLGQTVSGTIYVTFYSDQTATNFMRFYLDNKFVNEEHEYPYSLGGDTAGVVNGFDTRQLSNGQHLLRAEIHYKDGTVQMYEVTFTVNNSIQITPTCVPNPYPSCVMPNNDWTYCNVIAPNGQRYCNAPTPTCIPLPRCALPGSNPMCSLAAPPEGGTYCPVPLGPPTVKITAPEHNATVGIPKIIVKYSESGTLTGVDHVHLYLDDLPEVMDRDNDGTYTFSNLNLPIGEHRLTVSLTHADHTLFTNPEATYTIFFNVTNITPIPTLIPNKISWATQYATFDSDHFYINVDSKKFSSRGTNVQVHSDPPDSQNPNYTTLEVTWNELGTEMRFYLYFRKDSTDWWAEEIRIYDGKNPGNWKIFTGPYFKTPLNEVFRFDGRYPFGELSKHVIMENVTISAFGNGTISIVPTITECSLKSQGDANCDNKVDMIDYEIWRQGFIIITTGTITEFEQWRLQSIGLKEDPDFNQDTKIDLIDYEIWRQGFITSLAP